jgi:hypothetical protein
MLLRFGPSSPKIDSAEVYEAKGVGFSDKNLDTVPQDAAFAIRCFPFCFY